MRRLRIYLDTSVFGAIEDVKSAEAARRLFQAIAAERYIVLVSPETVREIGAAPEEARARYDEIPASSLESVSFGDDVQSLAQAYIVAGVLTSSHESDARHVAAATIARADVILSWNFRHMVNFERIRKFNGVNAMQGYPAIEIRSPLEMDYGSEDQDL
jgi:predicted nucleic acid-binding protein